MRQQECEPTTFHIRCSCLLISILVPHLKRDVVREVPELGVADVVVVDLNACYTPRYTPCRQTIYDMGIDSTSKTSIPPEFHLNMKITDPFPEQA